MINEILEKYMNNMGRCLIIAIGWFFGLLFAVFLIPREIGVWYMLLAPVYMLWGMFHISGFERKCIWKQTNETVKMSTGVLVRSNIIAMAWFIGLMFIATQLSSEIGAWYVGLGWLYMLLGMMYISNIERRYVKRNDE